MQNFLLKKGLNVSISGVLNDESIKDTTVKTVAILGDDYIGLKPRLSVAVDDPVVVGTPIFTHKDTPQVQVVSPVSGRIKAINRGARRKLISVEIEVAAEKAGDAINFSAVGDEKTPEGLAERLCQAGLWTSFRTRPYSKVPAPETRPAAIFVTAMDTDPLAANPAPIIAENAAAFARGVTAISQLSEGKTYVCHAGENDIAVGDSSSVETAVFSGPHPAGLAGTHIHFLEPIHGDKTVWTIGYQDVIAVGRLLETGQYDGERIISVAGPMCGEPRVVRTVVGASMADIAAPDLATDTPVRVISGSVLSGTMGAGETGYLGRYARQITLIEEDHKQIPMGWIRPMISKYAVQPVLGSALARGLFPLTSNLNGGRRAMVPVGTFETLMPQDYLPTQLLRALITMDTDQAQALGAMELDEEDLSLAGFACPAKYEYGLALRDCLTIIEKEG
ncbi:Na(+)-translocating NADH-quinone reductase subunit A [Sulfitobacter donghicola]|uniref:Na(+)-translocating NADH-quinone reductase subunit A n=1 Tax=Sulfitobacter donghicola DSW-25 = KCTC 12864 = JCM 14565 TaxID=1300350 RepID=A0A073IR33_9RHOB|nr:Na(+)-translocating NADH-quinone reductase subunit A [Sulfitobacter donghicola]KEJ87862.1 NADH-quinone reductase [Sulfitobacter donghicola DSW-25 = KCTC 12864 = JCM 14565]KIN59998.1 Na(+)-translocating NADH-quinone reductase subunit A [Sulfitobacter donghicola DSW-25 = KCTC 12864 = JCM 14565]